MRKRVLIATMACFMLAGCSSGVSQEQYDDLNTKYTESLNKIDSLEKDIDSYKSASSEASDSLKKVNDYISANIEGVVAAESITGNKKLLYLTIPFYADPSNAAYQSGKMVSQKWFDYDYVLTSLYIDDELASTIWLDCSTTDLTSHDWFLSEKTKAKDLAKFDTAETEKPDIAEEAKAASASKSQKNALSKALDYLNYTPFSRSGLIEQLEFEGFSKDEATYGADNCDADWNEQAAKKAQDYLDYTSFSRSGLIEQLEYEGFTKEQAAYGATAVGY